MTLLITGIVVSALGVGALSISVVLEWRTRAPIYALAMKMATGIIAIGATILCIAAID